MRENLRLADRFHLSEITDPAGAVLFLLWGGSGCAGNTLNHRDSHEPSDTQSGYTLSALSCHILHNQTSESNDCSLNSFRYSVVATYFHWASDDPVLGPCVIQICIFPVAGPRTLTHRYTSSCPVPMHEGTQCTSRMAPVVLCLQMNTFIWTHHVFYL